MMNAEEIGFVNLMWGDGPPHKCEHCIVCAHLVGGKSKEWIAVPSPYEGEPRDWMCPKCFKNLEQEQADPDNFMVICVACLQELHRGQKEGG